MTSSASAPHFLQPRCPSDLLFASFQLLMHLVCRSENIQRERALLYAVAPDAPAACHIVYDDLGRAGFRKPLRPSGTSHHFSEKRRSQNPDGIASRAPNRPIGLIPDRRQSRRQALRKNQESPRNPACANWAIASIPLPISLPTTIAWKARIHPGHLPQRNLIKTVIMICALKQHSVPRRHQMIDAPVSLDRRRGRRRRLASSQPHHPPVVRSSTLAAETR